MFRRPSVRRRTNVAGILAAILALAPGKTLAEPFTLHDALAYARQHAPEVEARRAARERLNAEARARGSWLPAPPQFGMEWTDREQAGEGSGDDRLFEASLPFEIFGQGIFRGRAAGAAKRLELIAVDGRARGWAAAVAWSYYEHLRWDWVRATARGQAETSRRLARSVELRYRAGDASALDADMARIESAAGERSLLAAERGWRRSREHLAALVGWPVGAALPPLDSLALVPPFPDTTALLARGMQERAGLRMAQAAVERSEAESRLATARLFPEAELGVFTGTDDGDEVLGLQVGLTVPFLGPGVAERGAANAASREQAALHASATRDAQADIVATRDEAGLAYEEVALFQRDVLPGIQAARERHHKAYAVGQIDLTTMLLAEQRLREAERAFAEALGVYTQSLHALEIATGMPVLSQEPLREEVEP